MSDRKPRSVALRRIGWEWTGPWVIANDGTGRRWYRPTNGLGGICVKGPLAPLVSDATAAVFDGMWPEGWERCTSPVHEGRTVVHSVRYHQRPEVQAEEERR